MKYSSILISCFCIAFFNLKAQHQINLSSGSLIIQEVDRVSIEGHTGSSVIVEIDGDREDTKDERAAGLREISARGLTDNTGIGLNKSTDGNTVRIEQLSPNSKTRYVFKVPSGVAVSYEHSTHNGKTLYIKDVKGELEVSTHYNKIKMANCTGPMAINSVYGSIEADFTKAALQKDVKLHSTYQHVDVTVPTGIKADFRLNTSYGKMYTDLNLDMSHRSDDMKEINPRKITGSLNGGGVDFSITATYKNIYLRKG